MNQKIIAVFLLLPLVAFPQKKGKGPQQKVVNVQKTSLTRDQEIQLGNEAAAQVGRSMEIVNDPQTEAWLNRIGQKLAQTPQANNYPYHFKLVNEDSINAFALPGGPMFVHTGLIKAADNESEVVGVLAHEMSHVALRHGAAQMTKQQRWDTVFGIVGAVAGMAGGGQCGLLCQAAQTGGGLLENSVLLRYSREHEQDADLNGARMMSAAGYNPIELAHFFEKLQAQLGSAAEPKGLAKFFSDHPPTGNRVQYVSQDIQFYPKQSYTADSGDFARIKRQVASLPPPKKMPGALLSPVQAQARQGLPDGFKDLQTQGFAIAYPSTWQAGAAQQGGSIFVIPQNGAKQSQNGGVELIWGGMLDYYQPKSAKDLSSANSELLQMLKQGDTNMRVDSTVQTVVGGQPAIMTRLLTKTSDQQEPDQVVYLYTVMRKDLLWNGAFAAPPSKLSQSEPVFRQIVRTIQFKD